MDEFLKTKMAMKQETFFLFFLCKNTTTNNILNNNKKLTKLGPHIFFGQFHSKAVRPSISEHTETQLFHLKMKEKSCWSRTMRFHCCQKKAFLKVFFFFSQMKLFCHENSERPWQTTYITKELGSRHISWALVWGTIKVESWC